MSTMDEKTVREQILQAVARLLKEGLIARTWGNISARLSDTQFLITPSGLAYETLRAEQLVIVNIEDCAYEGDIKPSSEKGIHADAYRLRPDVNFVIHTHQYYASVAGIGGTALTGFIHPAIGKRVPCAAYGLPGTKGLREAVAKEVAAWPDCPAFFLKHHGALCLGQDMEDAFAVAAALEEVCKERILRESAVRREIPAPRKLGVSRRKGDLFIMSRHGEPMWFAVRDSGMPPTAALHAAVYQAGGFRFVAHETSPEVLAVSAGGRRLRPYIDDLAQIAGADILCVEPTPGKVRAAIWGRNAVLLKDMGALCAAETESDLEAVRALLRKGCAASLYAAEMPGCRPLGVADAVLQRIVYQKSYAKKKEGV